MQALEIRLVYEQLLKLADINIATFQFEFFDLRIA